MWEKPKLGLALGAGGARGVAHIGVLKALEAAGVEISYLAGSSIGALVGAAYAVTRNAADLETRLMDFLSGDSYQASGLLLVREALADRGETVTRRLETWLKRTYLQAKLVARPAILDSGLFRAVIEHFVPKMNIEDLPLPFRALGTDLVSGRPVVFQGGPLRDAVYASAAIPGLVAPLEKGGMQIVDGGVINMVPALPVRHMGAEAVLAVDVEKTITQEEHPGAALDLLFRVEDVQNYYLREIQLREADLVLSPKVGHLHWSDFPQAAEMIQLGQDEAEGRLEEIRALVRRRWRRWRRPARPPARAWITI
ncbi:MAG: patatin-like phospholipase family protein [Thermodesulfobacteriota bacterium]